MPLPTGTHIGPYEILGPIGAGGMGEVYRARDAKLNRDVAIKVLPAGLADDADYLARFQREAQALAALHHPNIATIFGLERNAIVMELVEGEILRGPLPLAEALPIARQIAEALEAAHERGIIHRDLKPGNIIVTPDGLVKVLDFGLAKAVESPNASSANSPTLTMRATEAGLILGTAGYMSPEQAAGKPVDRRADIWSFGVVLHELITGKRLFDGETVSHTLADVLKGGIDLNPIPEGPVRELVRRCLDRNLKTRLQHIGEARIAIENYKGNPAAAKQRSMNWALTAVLAAVAAAGAWFLTWRSTRPPAPLAGVFEISFPRDDGAGAATVISPDGRMIVSTSRAGLLLRQMEATEMRLLPGTAGAPSPAWSPDSRSLVFMTGRKIHKLAVTGGLPQAIHDHPGGAPFMAWAPDGFVLFSGSGNGIWKVPAAGGAAARLTLPPKSDGAVAHLLPIVLPGGRNFLFQVRGSRPEREGIYAASLDGPSDQPGKRILDSRLNVLFARDPQGGSYLLFKKGDALFAQAFDTQALEMKGEPSLVAPNVSNAGPALNASMSDNGILLFSEVTENSGRRRQFTWFNREGKRIGDVGPPGQYLDMALSPDEKRLAATVNEGNGEMNVWMIGMRPGSQPIRFTFEPLWFLRWMVWSPDGTRLIYSSGIGGGSYQKPGDGTGVQKPIEGLVGNPTDFSPDGRMILSQRDQDLWLFADGKATQLTRTPYLETEARFSPDGKRIAYRSDETRRREVWVQDFPLTGVRFQISTEGGAAPQWRRDGSELFYRGEGGKMIAVAVKTAPAFEAAEHKVLFSAEATSYRAAADGQRFLLNIPLGDAEKAGPMKYLLKTDWSLGMKP